MASQTAQRFDLQLTSEPANIAPARLAIEKFAADAGFTEPAVADLGLCLNEALANIIRHAYSGEPGRPMTISCEFDAGELTISIRDWGNGRDPTETIRPHNPLVPGGLGMICLRSLLDRAEFIPQPDGMLLIMGKRVTKGTT